jgi:hypothetical protein
MKECTLDRYVEDTVPDISGKILVSDWIVLSLVLAFSLLTLVGPAVRAFYQIELNYNEGWNAYNAQRAVQHIPLYSARYNWTNTNYPSLSFFLIGNLARFVGSPVLTGRLVSVLSLLTCCVLVARIIQRLTGHWAPAIFGAAFCLALFCSAAPTFVGMNDPQMLAHPFLLMALWLYIRGPACGVMLFAITALFVIGGNVKHNPIAAPLATFCDLLTKSRGKALRFILYALLLIIVSVVLNIVVGGPFFISNILMPRYYSASRALASLLIGFGLLQIPLMVSLVWSFWHLRRGQYRVIALYFLGSLAVGLAFAGGSGIGPNIYFDSFFAMSIIMGLFLDFAWQWPVASLQRSGVSRSIVPLFLYGSVFFAFWQTPYANLPKFLSQLPSQERQFRSEVSALSAQPGPALCESLLRCFYSRKPFVFDPFNSTSLVRFKKLNPQEIVTQIADQRFGAIETYTPVSEVSQTPDYFPKEFLEPIDRYYQVSFRGPECVIYVPRGVGQHEPH